MRSCKLVFPLFSATLSLCRHFRVPLINKIWNVCWDINSLSRLSVQECQSIIDLKFEVMDWGKKLSEEEFSVLNDIENQFEEPNMISSSQHCALGSIHSSAYWKIYSSLLWLLIEDPILESEKPYRDSEIKWKHKLCAWKMKETYVSSEKEKCKRTNFATHGVTKYDLDIKTRMDVNWRKDIFSTTPGRLKRFKNQFLCTSTNL